MRSKYIKVFLAILGMVEWLWSYIYIVKFLLAYFTVTLQ